MRRYNLWFAYPEQKCVVKANSVPPAEYDWVARYGSKEAAEVALKREGLIPTDGILPPGGGSQRTPPVSDQSLLQAGFSYTPRAD